MAVKQPHRSPTYRRQKSKSGDRAFVELNGRRIWLGQYGTPESRQKYHQIVAEWMSNGRFLTPDSDEITVVELVARFWLHAQTYYRKPDGTKTSTVHNYRAALRPVKRLYGPMLAGDFGPLALKAVRQEMVDAGWCRKVINQGINLVRGVFRWGVAEELIPVETHTALLTVAPLRQGRSEVPDHEAVNPVPDAHIQEIQGHVSCQVWGLIQLQLLCGARGSELVGLKSMNLNTTGLTWTAEITDHKKRYAGRNRELYFGPRSQAILRPFMADRPIDACLFSPREAVAEQHRAAATHKRPGQPQAPRKTTRAVGDRYTPASYRRAIERACVAAGVPVWTPHRLRHNAGSFVRKEFGLDAAQIMLGHAHADATQVYAEVNRQKALQIAMKVG